MKWKYAVSLFKIIKRNLSEYVSTIQYFFSDTPIIYLDMSLKGEKFDTVFQFFCE